MFVHVVLFWLKENTPAEARDQLLADCRSLLARVPGVRTCEAGLAIRSPRPVVDASYSVGLLVCFDDQAGHDVYQEHPLHKQFIERNKAHWEKVQVYDFA